MKVLFVDMAASKPYTMNTLRSYAMGGTEATVLRVAGGLAKEGFEVFLFEGCDANRAELTVDGVRHIPDTAMPDVDVCIHLRTALFIEGFKELYPKARHIVWLHDIVTEPEPELVNADEVVCVSHWHLQQTCEAWPAEPAEFKARFIYNPVVVGGAKRHEKVPGRLGFFSSPHKGLKQTVELFQELRKKTPSLSLVVANPGYLPDMVPDGVTFLGQLPHHRVLEEMSKCEALFYPQTVFPETFGLVLAEANAMGTPVLAHDFGAAREVLMATHNNRRCNEVLDLNKEGYLEAALYRLRYAPPKAEADPRFSLENVLAQWKDLLNEAH